jgi:hypothetical protein
MPRVRIHDGVPSIPHTSSWSSQLGTETTLLLTMVAQIVQTTMILELLYYEMFIVVCGKWDQYDSYPWHLQSETVTA